MTNKIKKLIKYGKKYSKNQIMQMQFFWIFLKSGFFFLKLKK